MKCHCYETDTAFVFCVEGANDAQLENVIQHMAWRKSGDKFLLSYPHNAFSYQHEKELISNNFSRLGQKLFESPLSDMAWQAPLEQLVQLFNNADIEWYLVGSAGDALRGVEVKPSDIDIVVHTRDYSKAKEICYRDYSDSIIAPFTGCSEISPAKYFDNPLEYFINPLTYFGRLFLDGVLIEVTADEIWNAESRQSESKNPVWRDYEHSKYEKTMWRGHCIYLESLPHRHQIEVARNRIDRIKALEETIERVKHPKNTM